LSIAFIDSLLQFPFNTSTTTTFANNHAPVQTPVLANDFRAPDAHATFTEQISETYGHGGVPLFQIDLFAVVSVRASS
jgi:hypothetical protein